MAALLVDQYEVGIPYIVPPIRSIGGVALLSQGTYEFFPRLGATALAEAIANGELTGGDDFIGTYQCLVANCYLPNCSNVDENFILQG